MEEHRPERVAMGLMGGGEGTEISSFEPFRKACTHVSSGPVFAHSDHKQFVTCLFIQELLESIPNIGSVHIAFQEPLIVDAVGPVSETLDTCIECSVGVGVCGFAGTVGNEEHHGVLLQ